MRPQGIEVLDEAVHREGRIAGRATACPLVVSVDGRQIVEEGSERSEVIREPRTAVQERDGRPGARRLGPKIGAADRDRLVHWQAWSILRRTRRRRRRRREPAALTDPAAPHRYASAL
jgi:hypothetical protein